MLAPKLRFKEFEKSWSNIEIGKFLKIKSGLGFKAQEYTTEEEIRLLQIENVGYGNVKWTHNVKYVPNSYLNLHQDLVLNEGDLVLALNRPVTNDQLKIAKLNRKDSPSILYQRVGKLEFKNQNNDIDFIFQIFQKDVKNYVLNSSIGSDQPFISTTHLYRHKIHLPSKEEQTKIASFLSAVDEKISQLTQKHALLSQYKQGMMQKLFSQQIRFKADDGSEFGAWEEKKLKDVVEINPKAKKLPENFIYIDLESVEKGQLLLQKNIKLKDAPSRAQRLLAKGDVLFQMVRPYQQNNYYFNLNGEYVASTGYAQIRTKLDSKFIYYALHEKIFLDEVMNRCTGTSYPAINSSDLSSIEILIPCLEEQTKIANFLSSIDQKIEVVAQQIEQAKVWKKGLLQQMFV